MAMTMKMKMITTSAWLHSVEMTSRLADSVSASVSVDAAAAMIEMAVPVPGVTAMPLTPPGRLYEHLDGVSSGSAS